MEVVDARNIWSMLVVARPPARPLVRLCPVQGCAGGEGARRLSPIQPCMNKVMPEEGKLDEAVSRGVGIGLPLPP